MSHDTDPTKPTPNSEKFAPQNVKGPLKDQAPTDAGRGNPGSTEGNDVPQGSDGVTKQTPGA